MDAEHDDAPGAGPADTGPEPTALLEAWRRDGAALRDPVRLRLLEAMARRHGQYTGRAQVAIARRMQVLAGGADGPPAPPVATGDPRAMPVQPAAPGGTPLGELLGWLARERGAAGVDRADPAGRARVAPVADTPAGPASPGPKGIARPAGRPRTDTWPPALAGELKAVQLFGDTWSRLRADRRLTQARARVPDNAGPLNTHRLLHAAVAGMRATSPAYLDRFMGHVDALLALERLMADAGLLPAEGARAAADRKPPRPRSGGSA